MIWQFWHHGKNLAESGKLAFQNRFQQHINSRPGASHFTFLSSCIAFLKINKMQLLIHEMQNDNKCESTEVLTCNQIVSVS